MRINGNRDFLLLLVIVDFVQSKEMIWRYDTDISNPANWIGGDLAKNCKGIHFAPINDAPVFINDLTTPELTLPNDGEIILLEGASVRFKDNRKCINLKPLNYHDWYDKDSWLNADQNVAVPHKERIPCDGDIVEFPKGIHTRVTNSDDPSKLIKVELIKFGKKPDDHLALMDSYRSIIFYNPMDVFMFHMEKSKCTDRYGCPCHSLSVPCPPKDYNEKISCLSPIMPEGFCSEICGAYITYKPETGPKMNQLQHKLSQYTSNTHASRVMDYLGNDVIQVVFSEKEYDGKSLEEAQSFLEYLQSDKAQNLQLQQSGNYYVEGGSNSALSIVFGTFFAIAAFFAILFYVRGDTSFNQIISRFNRNRGSIFNTPFFARFDNTDDNLVLEGESMAGSILDIAKSFDNPMYGQDSPSSQNSPSTSTTEIQHENPLYDVVKDKGEE